MTTIYDPIQPWAITLLEERLNREIRLARILFMSGDTSDGVKERMQRHRENAAGYADEIRRLQVPT